MKKPEYSPNYFGASLEKYIKVRSIKEVVEETRAALSKSSLYPLFNDLFFRPQEVPLLKICDYMVMVYEEKYGESGATALNKHLQLFAQSLETPERNLQVLQQQQGFITSLQGYLQAKIDAERSLQNNSRIATQQITQYLLNPSSEAIRSHIRELIRNAAVAAPHSLLLFISKQLADQQSEVIDVLKQEAIALSNKSLGQDDR